MTIENHAGIIARVLVTPHPNPEVHSLAIGTVCNETVIVSKSTPTNSLGVYFSCDLQLSEEFCQANNLIRKTCPDTGKNIGGMFDVNRKVRAQTFQQVKSYGFWAPMSYLENVGIDISKLQEGDLVDTINGVPICRKFESPAQMRAKEAKQRADRKKSWWCRFKNWLTPKNKRIQIFPQHKDTSHFGKNVHRFTAGDDIVITEKMEGTSQRVAYTYEKRPLTTFERLMSYIVKVDNTILKKMNGTRRVNLNEPTANPWFSESWRHQVASSVLPYVQPYMQVYFEVVGFEGEKAIAPRQKIEDKKLKKLYGESMLYNYGLNPGSYEIYVYRITNILGDGTEVDYPWDDIVKWCTAYNIKHCPVLARFTYDGDTEKFVKLVAELSEGTSSVCPTHIREGVCVRANSNKWTVFKSKSFTYKVLAGLTQEQEGFIDEEDLA